MRRASQRIFLFLSVAAMAGCGGSETIEGTVTLDGQPLANVQILFDQPDVPGGQHFAGKTDEQGHYALRPVGGEGDAPLAGTYRVTLTTAVAERTAIEGMPLPPERIPAHYRGGSLQFEVPEGGTTEANFSLESKRPR